MTTIELVLALVMAVALASVLVPILPGSLIIGASGLIWASEGEDGRAWVVAAVAIGLLAAGAVVKYAVPGRRLAAAGIPGRTQLAGFALGVVGFFVIPVIGLFIGFVLGVWLAEVARLGAGEATESTLHALKAAGLSLLIEFVAAVTAVVVILSGMVVLS